MHAGNHNTPLLVWWLGCTEGLYYVSATTTLQQLVLITGCWHRPHKYVSLYGCAHGKRNWLQHFIRSSPSALPCRPLSATTIWKHHKGRSVLVAVAPEFCCTPMALSQGESFLPYSLPLIVFFLCVSHMSSRGQAFCWDWRSIMHHSSWTSLSSQIWRQRMGKDGLSRLNWFPYGTQNAHQERKPRPVLVMQEWLQSKAGGLRRTGSINLKLRSTQDKCAASTLWHALRGAWGGNSSFSGGCHWFSLRISTRLFPLEWHFQLPAPISVRI